MMKKNIMLILVILICQFFAIKLMFYLNEKYEGFSSKEIQEYMDKTDFYVAGKVTCIRYDGSAKGHYQMECDTISIQYKTDGGCFWGICDTAAKIVYFYSLKLDTDYVYIDSKKRLITASPVDTVSLVPFRMPFEPWFLRQFQFDGTISF